MRNRWLLLALLLVLPVFAAPAFSQDTSGVSSPVLEDPTAPQPPVAAPPAHAAAPHISKPSVSGAVHRHHLAVAPVKPSAPVQPSAPAAPPTVSSESSSLRHNQAIDGTRSAEENVRAARHASRPAYDQYSWHIVRLHGVPRRVYDFHVTGERWAARPPAPQPTAAAPVAAPATTAPTLTAPMPTQASEPAPVVVTKSATSSTGKAAPAPTTGGGVLDQTRDAQPSGTPITSAQYPGGDGVRTCLALLAVLVVIFYVVKFLKKRGIGVGAPGEAGVEAPRTAAPFGFGPVKPSKEPIIGMARTTSVPPSDAVSTSLAKIQMGGDLNVVGAQQLAGSGDVIFLVRAGDRMMLLSSNPNAGVKMVSEWDADVVPEPQLPVDDAPPSAFGAYLKEANGRAAARGIDDETADAIRERLNQASGRISRVTAHARDGSNNGH